MRNHLIASIIIFTFLFSACSVDAERPSPPSRESVEIRPMVVFDLADNQPLYLYVETQGLVEPRQEIRLTPRLSGFIREHRIRDGEKVTKGDVLLQFADEEWRLDLADATEDFNREYNRFLIEKRLRFGEESPADDDPELLSIKNQMGISQSRIRIDRSELMLSYSRLEAPFSGYVSTKENLSSGQYISASSDLGKLVDQSSVIVRFELLESELETVEPGFTVELTTTAGRQLTGKVERVSPVVNPESKTGQVVAVFDNPDGILRAGMTVNGRILTDRIEGRTRAPRSAMLHRDGRPLVFKLIDGTVHWIYIEPEAYTSEWVVFTHNNVAPGDTLAVDRHFAISHLQRIEARLR